MMSNDISSLTCTILTLLTLYGKPLSVGGLLLTSSNKGSICRPQNIFKFFLP
jgi:hypothetical protein